MLQSTMQYSRKQASDLGGSLASMPGREAVRAAASSCPAATCATARSGSGNHFFGLNSNSLT